MEVESINIEHYIELKKNAIIYLESVKPFYESIKHKYTCVYFDSPIPIKSRLIEIIENTTEQKKVALSRLTNTELLNIIDTEIKDKTVVIFFDHFERLTKKTIFEYQRLAAMQNIVIICSFQGNYKAEATPFFKTFKMLNGLDYKKDEEINITHSYYLIVSFLIFLIYFRFIYDHAYLIEFPVFWIATGILGGLWFAFLTYRTLIFIGGK